jgi:hypothetical protein
MAPLLSVRRIAYSPGTDKVVLGARRTLAHLRGKFGDRVDGWAEDRVGRLISELRRRHDTPMQWHLNSTFEWHRMEEYRLPWEAGQFLLEMQAWCEEKYPKHAFTVREAQWCWRVHLAAPDLNIYETWLIAQKFIRREVSSILWGEPLDMEGLEAYLRYGGWRSKEHRDRYHKAIQEGRARPLADESVSFGGDVEVIDGVKTLQYYAILPKSYLSPSEQ